MEGDKMNEGDGKGKVWRVSGITVDRQSQRERFRGCTKYCKHYMKKELVLKSVNRHGKHCYKAELC